MVTSLLTRKKSKWPPEKGAVNTPKVKNAYISRANIRLKMRTFHLVCACISFSCLPINYAFGQVGWFMFNLSAGLLNLVLRWSIPIPKQPIGK